MVIERTFHSMTNVKQRQAIVSNLSINIPNLMSYLDGADLKKGPFMYIHTSKFTIRLKRGEPQKYSITTSWFKRDHRKMSYLKIREKS